MTSTNYLGSFGINISFDFIQTIRLCEAILESDFDVHVPEEATPVLQYLENFFNLRYSVGLKNVPILTDIYINHRQPLCKIGNIEKPLIYSNQLVNRCRAKWSNHRNINFAFYGLITEKRKKKLEEWIALCFDQNISLASQTNSNNLIKHLIYKFKNITNNSKIKLEDIGLHCYGSKKGRISPDKFWDEAYYDNLCNSKFVLCPNGDHIWTYRFFESILCGAIPIVENTCYIYKEFDFFLMSDCVENLIYSEEIAKNNFLKAKNMLTIPKTLINSHIRELLKK